jgi:hypothetical protein
MKIEDYIEYYNKQVEILKKQYYYDSFQTNQELDSISEKISIYGNFVNVLSQIAIELSKEEK